MTLIRLAGPCIVILLSVTAVSAEDSHADHSEWQFELLFNPSISQLQRESEGMVMIYDGLKDWQVEHAMDEEFHRVDSMMFIRTMVTDREGKPITDAETGKAVVEDDDC